MEIPFKVVGAFPDQGWGDDLAEFTDRLREHPWGGQGLERIVVAPVAQGLKDWMPAAEFRHWKAGHKGGRIAATGAMAFVADDGLRTAVIPPLDDRWVFLTLAGHEAIEAALEARHFAEGHQFTDGTHTGIAHILWTEYVVERARTEIGTELGWTHVVVNSPIGQMEELESEIPALIRWAVRNDSAPQRIYQLWFEMARVYSMVLGKADGDSAEDQELIQQFRGLKLVVATSGGWDALNRTLDTAYREPESPANVHDQYVRNEGWGPLFDDLRGDWNDRYAAAGR